jgi:hypothetical protein
MKTYFTFTHASFQKNKLPLKKEAVVSKAKEGKNHADGVFFCADFLK